jgi:uroporphyrinogen decarboxylase
MTGRERILAAVQRKVPDRVPTMEWVLHPQVIKDMNGSTNDLDFVRTAGLDGVAVSLNYTKTPIDDRHILDEWGITRVTYDDYPNPVKFPVKDESDFDKLIIPDPDAEYRFDSIKNALKVLGDEISVVARVKDVFSHPRDLMGFEGFLMAFYLEPDLVQKMMEMCVEHSTRIARNLKEIGIEVIVIGDDIANNTGLLLKPEMYMEMVYPYFKQLVQNFKEIGLFVIKHTDGDLSAILDPLVDSGIDCLDPIDPLGNMDMGYVKQKYGDRIAFKGNVDCVDTLVNKSLDDVKKETIECILAGSIGGGHIISSSNSMHGGINPVNYQCFLDTVKEYGSYPIDVDRLNKEKAALCLK